MSRKDIVVSIALGVAIVVHLFNPALTVWYLVLLLVIIAVGSWFE